MDTVNHRNKRLAQASIFSTQNEAIWLIEKCTKVSNGF